MALRSYNIPNLTQGISQQPDAQRDPTQAEIQVNAVSSIVEGLRKRDSTQVLAEVSSTSFGDCFIHSILRDNTEEYLAVVSSSDVKVFDLEGNQKTVNKFEDLVEDLNDNIVSKQKKIDHLKLEIRRNIEKIDKIIKDYNANT